MRAIALAASFIALFGVARAEVQIVDGSGTGYAEIQDAVDAAAEGDVVLVGEGSYAGFTIQSKSLSVLAMDGASVDVHGRVFVRDLAEDQIVVIDGLRAVGEALPSVSRQGAFLLENLGTVRLQNCAFRGGEGTHDGKNTSITKGGDGLQINACTQVALVRCTTTGGRGAEPPGLRAAGSDGGVGLRSVDSIVAVYDSTIVGGDGGTAALFGGNAGEGGLAAGFSRVFVSGSAFTGGRGGTAWDIFGVDPGAGGDGLLVRLNAKVSLVDTGLTGGAGGSSAGPQGDPGQPLEAIGLARQLPGTARVFETTAVHSDNGTVSLLVRGDPGDRVYLAVSDQPAWRFRPAFNGVELVDVGPNIVITPHGTLPAGGEMEFNVRTARLAAGLLRRSLFVQGYVDTAGGKRRLGSPMHVVVIGSNSPPDCNGNGIADLADLLDGTSPDCDLNLVPDDCGMVDCNENGVLDSCDIRDGISADANQNGVPDECEPNLMVWVDDDALPGGDGSAGAPFQTIAEGLTAAPTSGDVVVVKDGLYTGAANRDLSFGASDITVRSENGPDACIIDCQLQGRAFLLPGGQTVAARIEGFTIRNGAGSSGGGAIRVVDGGATISDCVIHDCSAGTGVGGGIVADDSELALEDSVLIDNLATRGGALSLLGNGTQARVRRCTFLGNSATAGDGGAITTSGGVDTRIDIGHCRVLGNSATGNGGGLYSQSDATNIDNSLFAGNTAGDSGGAVTLWGGFNDWPFTITSSTIVDNTATSGIGGGVFGHAAAGPIANSVVVGNTAPGGSQLALEFEVFNAFINVASSDVEGGAGDVLVLDGQITFLSGNLDVDPAFVDRDGADDDPSTLADNDYRLASGSPAIDAGDNAASAQDTLDVDDDEDTLEPVPLDLDLLERFVDDPATPDTGSGSPPLVDMGCHEFQP